MLKIIMPPIHREGHLFIAIAVVVTLIGMAVEEWLGFAFLVITVWMVYFFRDPDRVTPDRAGLIVAPGDGKICLVEKAYLPKELVGDVSEEVWRVSIFLNVFNVHVNRVPIAGQITALHYHPGKFFNASLDKASEENERQLALVETVDGKKIGFVQIAGLVARRIVCQLQEGMPVKTGERYGIIRFGSRVDVYLPKGVEPLVAVGQTTVGGETVLADLVSEESKRGGREH